jgi:hypothetical protein
MNRRTFLFLLFALGILPGKAAAKRKPPDPLDIPWTRKPVESARSGIEILADGRMRCWIEHEVIRGVTPAMLVWWFKHLEGDMHYDGKRLSRYRVWHPRGHLAIEYASRNPDGTVGVGSVIHLTEMLGANPEYLVDVHSEIMKLDEQGFAHRPRMHGFRLAVMDYEFKAVAAGTSCRNSLTVGTASFLGRAVNPLIRSLAFDEARGRAWIKHNIEEVGNFESFLPQLYSLK